MDTLRFGSRRRLLSAAMTVRSVRGLRHAGKHKYCTGEMEEAGIYISGYLLDLVAVVIFSPSSFLFI